MSSNLVNNDSHNCKFEYITYHLRDNTGVCPIWKNKDAEICVIYKLIEKTGIK